VLAVILVLAELLVLAEPLLVQVAHLLARIASLLQSRSVEVRWACRADQQLYLTGCLLLTVARLPPAWLPDLLALPGLLEGPVVAQLV
jgi:hypothetical protein